MYNLFNLVLSPEGLVAIFAAVAVFASIVVVAMPLLEKDVLNSRMKNVALERDKLRQRERARLAGENRNGKAASLRNENRGGLVQTIVDKLNLKKSLADENTFINLVRAGFRKQSHIYVFLFFRLVLPLTLFAVACFYLFVISTLQQSAMIKLLIATVMAYAGFYLPIFYINNIIKKRQLSIRRAWPDALDLMLICVESGVSVEQAFIRVSKEIGGQSTELAEELVLTNAELSYLQERRKAYENFANRTGLDGVKSVTTALIQAERYGTPVGVALRVLAQENRDMRMAEAEKKAASLPPKLTVPMIVFFLPVLFMIIMGPAMIQVSKHW